MVEMDITNIDHRDESFDVIYCSHVLEHVTEDRRAMREFHRVLKKGGWAILLVPISADITLEDPSIVDPLERLRLFGEKDHVRRYGPDFVDRLTEVGFTVTVVRVSELFDRDQVTLMGLTKETGDIYYCTKTLAGDYPVDHLEVLVADGMSADGTREAVEEYRTRYPNIRVIDNPAKIVPTGLNLAIRAAGEIIVRIDAHTEYAADYIRQCVLLQETRADNVGGAVRTRATGFIQKAVSLAYHSPFSVGGARFHDVDHEGYEYSVVEVEPRA